MGAETKDLNPQKSVFLYLLFTLGIYFLLGLLGRIIPGDLGETISQFLRVIFAFIPVVSILLVRMITKDKSSWYFDIKVWKDMRTLLLTGFIPGVIVLSGTVVYYLIFPKELNPNMRSLFDLCSGYGLPVGFPVNA